MWVLDPRDNRVALRSVEVIRYELDRVLVGGGLSPGEIVVTAGVQVLRPGQEVRLLADEPVRAPGALPPAEARLRAEGVSGAAPAEAPGQGAAR